jgi:hypothetical protein
MEALVAAARQTGELPSLLLFLFSRQAQVLSADHGPENASRLQPLHINLISTAVLALTAPFLQNTEGFPL